MFSILKDFISSEELKNIYIFTKIFFYFLFLKFFIFENQLVNDFKKFNHINLNYQIQLSKTQIYLFIPNILYINIRKKGFIAFSMVWRLSMLRILHLSKYQIIQLFSSKIS